MRPKQSVSFLGFSLWLSTAGIHWWRPLAILAVTVVATAFAITFSFLIDCLQQDKWPWEMKP